MKRNEAQTSSHGYSEELWARYKYKEVKLNLMPPGIFFSCLDVGIRNEESNSPIILSISYKNIYIDKYITLNNDYMSYFTD